MVVSGEINYSIIAISTSNQGMTQAFYQTWEDYLGGGNNYCRAVFGTPTPDGGFLFIGDREGQFWLVKTDENGEIE